ncbi:hypothetical protein KIN20_022454 [Parelaphostrongylus tenuis]|uniref:Uncharacterized protein n=1 Tax=Parelaphostrongylus tenuis TaxID=148309 RepID=A0AAD5N907_PARTN|nr:hypothetical protein KIN20_022454 [Parelaphostrongylus tenuis]
MEAMPIFMFNLLRGTTGPLATHASGSIFANKVKIFADIEEFALFRSFKVQNLREKDEEDVVADETTDTETGFVSEKNAKRVVPAIESGIVFQIEEVNGLVEDKEVN